MLMPSALAPTLVIIVAFAHYTLVAKRTLTASTAFVCALALYDLELTGYRLPLRSLMVRKRPHYSTRRYAD